MPIRQIIIALLILCLLTVFAYASDAEDTMIDGISPQEGLPDEVVSQIGDFQNEETGNFMNTILELVVNALGNVDGALKEGLRCCGMILAAVLICGLSEASQEAAGVSALVGALAIAAVGFGNLNAMIGVGIQTIEAVDTYATLLIPGLASVAAMSGAVTTAGALNTVTVPFIKLLMSAIRYILIPGIYLLVVLAVAEAALDSGKLSEMREFVRWLVSGTLKTSIFIFTGFLTVTGVLSGAADAARIKAARMALSGTVPVVGGILSDASDTLLTSAAAVKSAVGTYGLIAVLAICILPFLRVAVQHLLLKVTTAIAALVGRDCHIALVARMTDAMGFVVGIIGTYSLMLLICITLFVKITV